MDQGDRDMTSLQRVVDTGSRPSVDSKSSTVIRTYMSAMTRQRAPVERAIMNYDEQFITSFKDKRIHC